MNKQISIYLAEQWSKVQVDLAVASNCKHFTESSHYADLLWGTGDELERRARVPKLREGIAISAADEYYQQLDTCPTLTEIADWLQSSVTNMRKPSVATA